MFEQAATQGEDRQSQQQRAEGGQSLLSKPRPKGMTGELVCLYSIFQETQESNGGGGTINSGKRNLFILKGSSKQGAEGGQAFLEDEISISKKHQSGSGE